MHLVDIDLLWLAISGLGICLAIELVLGVEQVQDR
jgi:hypothetical protein